MRWLLNVSGVWTIEKRTEQPVTETHLQLFLQSILNVFKKQFGHDPEFQHAFRLGTSDALLSRQETWVPSCPKWAGPACHLFSWEGREDSRYLWSPSDMQPLKTGREEIQPLKIFVRVSRQIPRNLYMPLDWHPLPWKRQIQSVDSKIPISPFLLLSGPPNFRFGAESTKLKRWHTQWHLYQFTSTSYEVPGVRSSVLPKHSCIQ